MRIRGHLQLAMYAVHLAAGNSIYCKRIKSATIEDYVYSVATFLGFFMGTDVRKDNPTDKHHGKLLSSVYHDIRSYEAIPNRREPYTLSMHTYARALAQTADTRELVPALVDGFEQGLCAGYRLSEWAQPNGQRLVTKPQLTKLPSGGRGTRAIVPADLTCKPTTGGPTLSGLAILTIPVKSIAKLWIVFRVQKNGQHGEKKLFVPNHATDGICMVGAAYRALTRFRTLQLLDGRLDENHTPLSVYFHAPSNSVRLVTSSDIDTFMRKLAAHVYQLHPVRDADDIAKWGTHSLRVGACVILHAMGFSPTDIQWILRWRSHAFVAYLRNVAILSNRQNKAFNKAASMPHLL